MQKDFKIVYYEKTNGDAPFIDFYNKQSKKMQMRILSCIDILKYKGNMISMPLSKKVDDYIYELRIVQGNNYSRVLYFFYINKTIVITNGFIKKSNKLPRNEIKKANSYRNEWIRMAKNEKDKN